MGKNKVFIIIPTIRNLKFLKYWKDEFKDCVGIIIEDNYKKSISLPKNYFKKIYYFNWQNIDSDLGKNSWIISRKNAGIRVYGFLKAYQLGAEVIITLDDDCYPVKNQNLVEQHIKNLNLKAAADNWFSTYPHDKFNFTRGYPYHIRNKKEVVISHGLWSNKLDLDAKTELKLKKLNEPILSSNYLQFIPKNYFFPMCSMNLAFKVKITPIMFFPMMGYDNYGNKWPFDRFDDIWAGIFAKKVIDHLEYGVVNGIPFVNHKKASDPKKNLEKEKKGLIVNEYLYQKVNKVKLISKNLKDSYLELFEKLDFSDIKDLEQKKYFIKLKQAVRNWVELF